MRKKRKRKKAPMCSVCKKAGVRGSCEECLEIRRTLSAIHKDYDVGDRTQADEVFDRRMIHHQRTAIIREQRR